MQCTCSKWLHLPTQQRETRAKDTSGRTQSILRTIKYQLNVSIVYKHMNKLQNQSGSNLENLKQQRETRAKDTTSRGTQSILRLIKYELNYSIVYKQPSLSRPCSDLFDPI